MAARCQGRFYMRRFLFFCFVVLAVGQPGLRADVRGKLAQLAQQREHLPFFRQVAQAPLFQVGRVTHVGQLR